MLVLVLPFPSLRGRAVMAGKFRFRLKAGNGETVAVGEAYDTMAAAQEGCAAVQRAAEGASVVEGDNSAATRY
jgi:uncharacterized protein